MAPLEKFFIAKEVLERVTLFPPYSLSWLQTFYNQLLIEPKTWDFLTFLSLYSTDFPNLKYADDTLIIMEGSARHLFTLKALINSFSASSGLNVNFSKSMMIPINIPKNRIIHLAATFGCSIGSLLFPYLGLPLGLTKPRVDDFLPPINRCLKRLTSTYPFLSQAGKLQMVNSVFSSLPTFFMRTFLLHSSIREQVDKFRKHCLWRGSDANNRINAKAALPLVTEAKKDGGLRILDLKTFNEAVLLK